MPLVVGQNTYVSLADAEEYLATFGEEGAVIDEPSLAKATLAIDRLYRGRFKGTKTDAAQALEFPRNGDTTIPVALEQATAELALLILDDLDPYVQPDALVLEESIKIDVLETQRKFSPAGQQARQLFRIEVILAPLIYAASGLAWADVVQA